MNDKVFKTVVGISLLLVVCFGGLLFFHENKGCAHENTVAEQNQQGEALLEMFKVGLEKSQIDNSSTGAESTQKPEYYYGMVEAAIQQSSQYPELIADFWRLFEKHLDNIVATPVARIELLDLFNQQVELCANHCKNIEQYKKLWNTSEDISSYRKRLIEAEVEKGLTLLEETQKSDAQLIVRVLKNENVDNNDGKTDIENANSNKATYSDLLFSYIFLTDYVSESSKEFQNRFQKLVETAGSQILSEIKTKYEGYEKRFTDIKDSFQKERILPVRVDNSNNGKIEFGVGVSHQLLLDLQVFITKDLNTSIFQTLTSISPVDVMELQAKAASLLEKTRILNQMRYNLWAKNVINETNRVTQFDGLSMISVEFLYPVVSAYYHDKMKKVMMELKDSAIISHNYTQMILKDKAPLSAF